MLSIQGQRSIPRAPEAIWADLMQPEFLCRSIPGCREVEVSGPCAYRFVLRIGHGVIRGKFHGEVRWTEVSDGRSYRVEFFAKGFAGSVTGSSSVDLRPNDDSTETEVIFDGEARVGGLLRTVSRHVFEDAITSLTHHFFEELSRP